MFCFCFLIIVTERSADHDPDEVSQGRQGSALSSEGYLTSYDLCREACTADTPRDLDKKRPLARWH
jgi:hypothetical protein